MNITLHVVAYLAQEIVGGILKMFNALNIVGVVIVATTSVRFE